MVFYEKDLDSGKFLESHSILINDPLRIKVAEDKSSNPILSKNRVHVCTNGDLLWFSGQRAHYALNILSAGSTCPEIF